LTAIHFDYISVGSPVDGHVVLASTTELDKPLVACSRTGYELGIAPFSSKLIDNIIPVASYGSLVAGVRPPSVLVDRVVACSPLGVLGDITPKAVLTDMIISRSAEENLIIAGGKRHGRIADGGLQYQGQIERRGSVGWWDTSDDDKPKD
jgi:hypothetical protein